jgi:hypothetical protein
MSNCVLALSRAFTTWQVKDGSTMEEAAGDRPYQGVPAEPLEGACAWEAARLLENAAP